MVNILSIHLNIWFLMLFLKGLILMPQPIKRRSRLSALSLFLDVSLSEVQLICESETYIPEFHFFVNVKIFCALLMYCH